jgi:hypothetical protein
MLKEHSKKFCTIIPLNPTSSCLISTVALVLLRFLCGGKGTMVPVSVPLNHGQRLCVLLTHLL